MLGLAASSSRKFAHTSPAVTFKTPSTAIGTALSKRLGERSGTSKGFPKKSRVRKQKTIEAANWELRSVK